MLQTQKIALVFPGQGSQAVGMGKELASTFPSARELFERADEILGFSISRLMWEGPETELNDTVNTQPALFIHSCAALHVFEERFSETRPSFVAGHSMGELSAMMAAKALSFEDGLRLVRRRGELMKLAGEISPGGMAAIMGLDIPVLDKICAEASTDNEIVQVANDNCPGQVVISGARTALERALVLAKEAGARRAVPLAVSIAAHSPLMLSAQEEWDRAISLVSIRDPDVPVVGNVTALPLTKASQLQEDIQAQFTARVRWTESVRFMKLQGIHHFIELGSGSVLVGLIKRIDPEVAGHTLGTPLDIETLTNL